MGQKRWNPHGCKKCKFNDIFDMWVELKKGLKENTFQNYQYMYHQFVYPDFGQIKVTKLKRSDVRRFYNMLADKRNLKIATIDNVHTVLYQVLDLAVEDEYLRSNPSDKALKELKQSRSFNMGKKKALTLEEQQIFMEFLGKNGQRIVPMMEDVKNASLQEKNYQEEAEISCSAKIDGYTNFVFVNRFGNVQHQGTLNKVF